MTAVVPGVFIYCRDNRGMFDRILFPTDGSEGNLQSEIRLPNDRLSELTEQYAGGEAAIEASGN